MKKMLTAIVFYFTFQSTVSAQITTFDTCQYIHQFNGEWLYANGNDTIRVFLRAQRNTYTGLHSLEDRLFGWHEYKQSNTVIESTYANRYMTISNVDTITKRSFSIWLKMGTDNDCNGIPRTAGGTIRDYLQANETKIVTVKLDATGTIMTWEQRHSEGFGVFTGATGMTLPKEFILIKQ